MPPAVVFQRRAEAAGRLYHAGTELARYAGDYLSACKDGRHSQREPVAHAELLSMVRRLYGLLGRMEVRLQGVGEFVSDDAVQAELGL